MFETPESPLNPMELEAILHTPDPSILERLEAWIARAIIEAPEELRRVLYKVDISEARAREAAAKEDGPRALAILMLEREAEKARSRSEHKSPPANEDADLAW